MRVNLYRKAIHRASPEIRKDWVGGKVLQIFNIKFKQKTDIYNNLFNQQYNLIYNLLPMLQLTTLVKPLELVSEKISEVISDDLHWVEPLTVKNFAASETSGNRTVQSPKKVCARAWWMTTLSIRQFWLLLLHCLAQFVELGAVFLRIYRLALTNCGSSSKNNTPL